MVWVFQVEIQTVPVVRLFTNELRCIQEGCGRTWTSTYTWTIDNQIQDSKCKDCLVDVMPYKIVGTCVLELNSNDSLA